MTAVLVCGVAGTAVQLLLVLLKLVMVFSIVLYRCNSLLCTAEMGSGCPAKTSACEAVDKLQSCSVFLTALRHSYGLSWTEVS